MEKNATASLPPPVYAAPNYADTPPPLQQDKIMVTPLPPLGPNSVNAVCPSCHAVITTRILMESSTKTHVVAAILCILFWPCVCLPYCMDSCKNATHYCPNCNAYIGTYSS